MELSQITLYFQSILFRTCIALLIAIFFVFILQSNLLKNFIDFFKKQKVFFNFICALILFSLTRYAYPTSDEKRAYRDYIKNQSKTDSVKNNDGSNQDRLSHSITNLCFESITTMSNGVSLSISWPTNMFKEGTILDFFTRINSFTNEWSWIDSQEVSPGETNLTYCILYDNYVEITNRPLAMFFMAKDRFSSANTMTDSDGDGIPDVYEIHNGGNPYIKDSSSLPCITVGTNGLYQNIQDAISASTNYSIISLNAETFNLSRQIEMPSYPIILEGPRDGYAVINSSANIGAIMLTQEQTKETVIRNVILNLQATKGFQSGFWVGGNLPWSGKGAAATFENIHVRASYPNVLYFGWVFYRDESGASLITNCTMNAAGTTQSLGISAFNAASNIVKDTYFLNMPTNSGNTNSIAMIVRESSNSYIYVEAPINNPNLSWAGYPLNSSYSSAKDSDGDGISDYDEIYTYNIDPWLIDSDGDSFNDYDEIQSGTNPQDFKSFHTCFEIAITNTVYNSNTTNYVFYGSVENWQENLLLISSEYGCVSNIEASVAMEVLQIGSFCDLNKNGAYDEESDVLIIKNDVDFFATKHFFASFGDIDRDGISDAQERIDGSNPYDGKSFKISAICYITNKDPVDSTTNYVFVSQEKNKMTLPCVGSFSSSNFSYVFNEVVTNSCIYLNCFRDYNKNGIYDENDSCYSWQINKTTGTITSVIKDRDNDGIDDSVEIKNGTDPNNSKNFCYSINARILDIFSTTNYLKVVSMFGTNLVSDVQTATNNISYFSLPHRVTSMGEYYSILFWDDINNNDKLDEIEAFSKETIKPNGHLTTYVKSLYTYNFDVDRNGLFDWWEIKTGLTNITEEYDETTDIDGDGLINLHEYWSDTNPLVPDGSNTIISTLINSIDDRLKHIPNPETALPIYSNYYENVSNGAFVLNESRWTTNIDFSCLSVWNSSSEPNEHGGVAISKRHLFFAKHWALRAGANLKFLGTNGVIYTRTVANTKYLTINGVEDDITIASLTEDLPDEVVPVSVLSPKAYKKIRRGNYLPIIAVNQDKKALVFDLSHISYPGDTSCITKLKSPRNELRSNFSMPIRGGDSGSPSFLLYNNKLILLGTHWMVNIDSSAAMAIEEIQEAMDYLYPGYYLTLEDFDY